MKKLVISSVLFCLLVMTGQKGFAQEDSASVSIGLDLLSTVLVFVNGGYGAFLHTDFKLADFMSLEVPLAFEGAPIIINNVKVGEIQDLIIGITPKFYLSGNPFNGLWIAPRFDLIAIVTGSGLMMGRVYGLLGYKTCFGGNSGFYGEVSVGYKLGIPISAGTEYFALLLSGFSLNLNLGVAF